MPNTAIVYFSQGRTTALVAEQITEPWIDMNKILCQRLYIIRLHLTAQTPADDVLQTYNVQCQQLHQMAPPQKIPHRTIFFLIDISFWQYPQSEHFSKPEGIILFIGMLQSGVFLDLRWIGQMYLVSLFHKQIYRPRPVAVDSTTIPSMSRLKGFSTFTKSTSSFRGFCR